MRQKLPALFAILLLALSGCTTGGTGSLFKSALATEPGTVDSGEAAALISAYRTGKGLKPVTVDATLTKIAAIHSEKMARTGTMAHVLPGEGSFQQRIAAGGFQASMAAENVAAGQDNLAEVLEAWRKSPGHNANLLLSNVSLIGIAVVVAPEDRYKTYWTLVLGERYVPRAGMAGPDAGPVVTIGGGVN